MHEIKKKLEEEIRALDHELKVQLPKEIQRAREYGDLRENALPRLKSGLSKLGIFR